MRQLPEVTRKAILSGAQVHLRADGTYDRAGLQRVADAYGVSLRSVQRIVSDQSAAAIVEVSVAGKQAYQRELTSGPVLTGTDGLLQALAVTAGNRIRAHEWAINNLGYSRSYRTFIRDIEKLDPALVAGAETGRKGLTKNRIYLTNVIPHRNHTWAVDHTKADIWILPERGNTAFRPWITMVVDGATDMWLAVVPWEGNLNTERVAVALTRAAVGDAVERDQAPTIGGLPVVVVFDNAAEHLAAGVIEGCLRLGVVASPTTPFHSWENGRVETSHHHLAEDLLARLPGYSKGGENESGKPRFAPAPPRHPGGERDLDRAPTALIRMPAFAALLEEYRVKRNATVKDRHGLTPLDRWNADATALTLIDPNVMLANLTVTSGTHTVNRAGIRFNKRDYVSDALARYRGRELTVRYLPTVQEWIELFDGSEYVGRAWLATQLPERERNRIMLDRARQEVRYRRVEQAARQHRSHLAAAVADGWDPDDLPEGPGLLSAFVDDEPEQAQPLPVVSDQSDSVTQQRRKKAARDLVDRLLDEGLELDPRPRDTEGDQS